MKQSIEWHKQCLENMISNLERDMIRLNNQQDTVSRRKEAVAVYRYQIEEAERANKDAFDSGKWRRKIPVKLTIPYGWEKEK